MHEFSIAMNIVEIAEAEAAKANSNEVKELVLDVGTLSGIEFYALDAALEMAVKNTILEQAEITVNKIKAKAKCTECSSKFDINHVFDPCPKCGSLYHEVISGKELQVRSLVIDVDE
jgi:hydrogenase nickel incorporation protein HypA/HybF